MEKLSSNSYRQSFEKIKHLTKPNLLLYWGDLLGTAACCYGLMYLCMTSPVLSLERWLSFAICSFFVNRGIYFIHEIVHQGKYLKGFETAHSLLFGCVFKIPSYIHTPHHYHHRSTSYATQDDPEYDDAWIGKSLGNYLSVIPVSLMIPVILFVRFGLVPLCYPFMSETQRNKVFQKASTFAMNPKYERPMHTKEEFKNWMIQDGLACAINGSVLIMFLTSNMSLANFLTFHLFCSTFFFLNFYRALVAHKYVADPSNKTIEAQVKDSISIPSSITDFFWAPLGLKFHSLHHYFPTIPYHNLQKAHEILVAAGDEVYLSSLESSLPEALRKAGTGENRKDGSVSGEGEVKIAA